MSQSELRPYYRNVGSFRGRGQLHDNYAYHPYNPSLRPSWDIVNDLGFRSYSTKDWFKLAAKKLAVVEGWKAATGTYFVPQYNDPAKKMSSTGTAQPTPSVQQSSSSSSSQNNPMFVTPGESRKRARTSGSSRSSVGGVVVATNHGMKNHVRTLTMSVPRGLSALPKHIRRTSDTVWATEYGTYPSFVLTSSNSCFGTQVCGDAYSSKSNYKEYVDTSAGSKTAPADEKAVSGQYACCELVVLPPGQQRDDMNGTLSGLLDFFYSRNVGHKAFINNTDGVVGGAVSRSLYETSTSDTSTTSGEVQTIDELRNCEMLLKYTVNLAFYNAEVYTQIADVYVFSRKSVTAFMDPADEYPITPAFAMVKGAQQLDSSNDNDVNFYPWEVGHKPTASKYFNENFKAVSKRTIELQAGAEVKISFQRGVVHVQGREVVLGAYESTTQNKSNYVRGLTYYIFIRVRGQRGLVECNPVQGGSVTGFSVPSHNITVANKTGTIDGTITSNTLSTANLDNPTSVANTAWVTTETGGLQTENSYSATYITSGAVTKATSTYGQLTSLPGKIYVQGSERISVRAMKGVNRSVNLASVPREIDVASNAVIINPMTNAPTSAVFTGVDTSAGNG